MRRADRLFQILQLLRGRPSATARELALELEVSERTIYRDVADLMKSGVAIEGEAGVGYVLDESFSLPPLMFTRPEVEALVAGMRMIEAWGDAQLARDARAVLGKVETVLADPLREALRAVPIFAPDLQALGRTENIGILRRATLERNKLCFTYEDRAGVRTRRTVRPLGLACWANAWTLLGWCELREDFRNFRIDRMEALEVLEERFVAEPGRDLPAFLERVHSESEGERPSA